jgi:hypothetical protein
VCMESSFCLFYGTGRRAHPANLSHNAARTLWLPYLRHRNKDLIACQETIFIVRLQQ